MKYKYPIYINKPKIFISLISKTTSLIRSLQSDISKYEHIIKITTKYIQSNKLSDSNVNVQSIIQKCSSLLNKLNNEHNKIINVLYHIEKHVLNVDDIDEPQENTINDLYGADIRKHIKNINIYFNKKIDPLFSNLYLENLYFDLEETYNKKIK